jgi:hypothetical protein
LRRSSTIGLAFGLSGLIASTAVAGMVLFSLKTTLPPGDIVIAEPAAASLSRAPEVPAATLISLSTAPAVKTPLQDFSVPAVVETETAIETEAPEDSSAKEVDIPLPRRKPSKNMELAATVAGLAAFSSNDGAPPLPATRNYGNWPKDAVAGAREKCERLLRGLDVEFKSKDPIGSPRGCGIAYPLSVSAIAGVAITPSATLNCEMVAALHAWITQVAQPAAKQEFKTRLTGLQNASSYACRLRNNSSSGKLSEHALGNAMDIADFRFSNRMEASVAGSWSGSIKGLSLSSRGDFMKRTRTGACKYFNTVLGPGSDPFHKDHYHLDLMKLRAGRGKYCR